ncbi:MAG: PTS system mannose/fructose/sorbose family transporter subunit IID [Elusimicrobia bacterium]|nr:PTS system mannose/fructose/sorbose family transporter subunit IID [Elusimicrobiota bacterium]
MSKRVKIGAREKKTLMRIFWRSFLLQAVWSYERMQNIGFLFSILPKLKELYGNDIDRLKESCRRHLGYFNTHPYMASFILGHVARCEERIAAGEPGVVEEVNRFKLQMAGPLAATGDKYFWSVFRPLVGLIGVLLFLLGVQPYYLIPLIFILLYNLPTYRHRYKMLVYGYYKKEKMSELMKNAKVHVSLSIMPFAGLLTVLACVVLFSLELGAVRGPVFAGVTVLVAMLRKYLRISATRLLYIVVLISIIGGLIF